MCTANFVIFVSTIPQNLQVQFSLFTIFCCFLSNLFISEINNLIDTTNNVGEEEDDYLLAYQNRCLFENAILNPSCSSSLHKTVNTTLLEILLAVHF